MEEPKDPEDQVAKQLYSLYHLAYGEHIHANSKVRHSPYKWEDLPGINPSAQVGWKKLAQFFIEAVGK